jgi:hypothetical protein
MSSDPTIEALNRLTPGRKWTTDDPSDSPSEYMLAHDHHCLTVFRGQHVLWAWEWRFGRGLLDRDYRKGHASATNAAREALSVIRKFARALLALAEEE